MTRPATRLVTALAWALERLDSEEHRYVERYAPCPNGCTFEPVIERADDGLGTVENMTRVAGPADCPLCEFGTVEDEDAAHIEPLISDLRILLFRLQGVPASPVGQPEHAGDPLILSDVLRRLLADRTVYATTDHLPNIGLAEFTIDGYIALSPDDAATVERARAARNHPDTQET